MGKRKFIALIIFLSSIGFSVFTIRSGSPQGDGLGVSFEKSERSNVQFQLNRGLTNDAVPRISSEDENITEKIARLYREEIFKLNELGGFKNGAPIAIPNENTLTNILTEELSRKIVISTFNTEDILKSEDNSSDSIIKYLNQISSSYLENFGKEEKIFFAILAEAVVNQEIRPLEQYLKALRGHLDKLLTIRVPSRLEDFHLEMLNLWQKRLTLGTILLNNQEDPLKAVVALDELINSVEAEEAILKKLETGFTN